MKNRYCQSWLTIPVFTRILNVTIYKEVIIMTERSLKTLVLKYPDKIMYPFDMLYEEIGYDGICLLSDMYSGSSLYIPSKKRMFSKCLSEELLKEFDGFNIRQLAQKYGFCERTVRCILTNSHKTR